MMPADNFNPSTTPRGTALDPAPQHGQLIGVAPSAYPLTVTEARPPSPPAVSGAPTLGGLWHAFRRRWLLATLSATVAALAVLLVMLELVPGVYPAAARVRISSQPPPSLPELNEHAPEFKPFQAAQEALAKSPVILSAALNRDEIKDLPTIRSLVNPVAWLENVVKTDTNLGMEILRITVATGDPEEARLLANAVAKALVEYNDQEEKRKRQVVLEQMRQKFLEAQRSLHDKEMLLSQLMKDLQFDDPTMQRIKLEAAQRQVEDARKHRFEVELKIGEHEVELKSLEKEEKELPQKQIPDLVIDRVLKDDLQMAQLHKQLTDANVKVRQAEEAVASNPVGQRELQGYLKNQQDALEAIARYRKSQLPKVQQQLVAENREKQSDLQRKLDVLKNRKKAMDEEVLRLEQRARDLANQQISPNIEKLRSEIEVAKNSLVRMGERIAGLKMAPDVNSRVSLLQEATTPATIDRSRQIRFGGTASLAVFGLVLFGITYWEFRSRRVATPEDVSRGLGLNLLGTLPQLPLRARGGQVDPHWQTRMAEAVDGVRTFMLHTARANELRVVMVTSPWSGEGKTSLASQLAASLARAWRKTLLVDGDLRNPAVHQLFNKPGEPGLCEVLRGETAVADTIQPTSISRLWIMPAGQWDSHAIQALAQDGVKALFAELKEQYDFIVVDSGPVLPMADSLLLGQHVDGVVLSVLRDVSRAPAVYEAQQKLQNLNIRILGAVFVGNPEPEPHRYPAPAGAAS